MTTSKQFSSNSKFWMFSLLLLVLSTLSVLAPDAQGPPEPVSKVIVQADTANVAADAVRAVGRSRHPG